MKEIRSIDPKSIFKIGLVIYLSLGLVFSILMLIFGAGVVGAVPFSARFGQLGIGVLGALLGTIVYGLVGAGVLALGAVLYNFVAHKIGGIKVELNE